MLERIELKGQATGYITRMRRSPVPVNVVSLVTPLPIRYPLVTPGLVQHAGIDSQTSPDWPPQGRAEMSGSTLYTLNAAWINKKVPGGCSILGSGWAASIKSPVLSLQISAPDFTDL
ncbi:unnamed protein product [Clonostachys byssicola]|uniref:Uncharacterized protein n=1 Tax=Clonostachys byssicola TaxID=160290 RepID=A0A9N9YC43_9HYPO|nr:unnamed protein product [Clonostachys byssicola]